MKIFFTIFLISFISVTFSQEVKKIEILHADMIDYDEELLGPEIKRLTGNVKFKHNDAIMDCDSAYFNTVHNIMYAFSNIHINQGDTLHLYGDSLMYDGATKIAHVRYNVRLTQDESILTTDSLDYYRMEDYAHYFDYGKIVDSDNVLESIYGYYYTVPKDYIAIDSVVLVNPDYTMYSDTLKYNINTEILYFFGPTTIVSDSNLIYCENGWYNTKTDISQYNKNAYYKNNTQKLQGDSLYYDRKIGIGKAFENVELTDTVENVILLGHYGIYYENPERSMFTDSAVFIQVTDEDSMFLHADTLRYKTLIDTIISTFCVATNDSILLDSNVAVIDTIVYTADSIKFSYDTLNFISHSTALYVDTLFFTPDSFSVNIDTLLIVFDSLLIEQSSIAKSKLMWAYYRVKIFKSDMQSKCDSMAYVMRDSVIEMYHEPVIWSEKNQLTAEYIELHTKNDKPDYIVMEKASFIISKEDSSRFNQIKGKDMIGYFKDDSLYRVDVNGNGQSIYYVKERDEKDNKEKLIGLNKSEASKLVIYLEDSEPHKIMYLTAPLGTLNPVDHLPAAELKFKGFLWLENLRPFKKEDIFVWTSFTRYFNFITADTLLNDTIKIEKEGIIEIDENPELSTEKDTIPLPEKPEENSNKEAEPPEKTE